MNVLTATNSFASGLQAYDISARKLVNHINERGSSISRTPIKTLLQKGVWPKPATVEKIKRSINQMLEGKATKQEIDAMFKGAPQTKSTEKAVYKAILDQLNTHELSQTFACEMLNEAGIKISVASVNQILNHGNWPKTKSQSEIQRCITYWLQQYDATLTHEKLWAETAKPRTYDPKKGVYTKTKNIKQKDIFIDFDNLEPEMLSQKTLQHFGLTKHPFKNDIRSSQDVYLGEQQMLIREAMHQAAIDGGILAITGECGAGKSELRKYFIDHISKADDTIKVIEPMLIDKTRLTAEKVFEAIADELALPGRRMDLEQRTRQVARALIESSKAGMRHVLIIEEAHDLSIKVIKYLKRIWELSDGYRNLVGIILIGQPELKAMLAPQQHNVREFARRCTMLEILPLGIELQRYIQHKFKRCHIDYLKIITDEGIEALKYRLQGKKRYGTHSTEMADMSYPLIVNNFLVNSMNLAAQLNEPVITPDVIAEL